MTSTTVAEFANELKKSPDTLLEQLRSAGAVVTDVITVVDRNEGAGRTLQDLDIILTPLVRMQDLINE